MSMHCKIFGCDLTFADRTYVAIEVLTQNDW